MGSLRERGIKTQTTQINKNNFENQKNLIKDDLLTQAVFIISIYNSVHN